MAKRPSIEKAGKVWLAAMQETAEVGDREGFLLIVQNWTSDEGSINSAMQAWDDKRREISRRGGPPVFSP